MRFDSVDGSKPTQSTVKTGTLATPPQQNPQRQGFRFDGWTRDGQPYDFRTPILQDTTLKAQWSKTTDWTLSPDHGPATGARLTINPPDWHEPQFASIQAAGEQTVGLTGDGRIYTWTQDGTPKQVPSPVQAPDGFHYQQAAAGSRRQAALGSDQQIYTWTSQQPEPATLDTSGNIQFTSISMNGDRLIAVDRQGRVHVFQADQTNNQDPNPKPTEQATTSMPGQAQAVLAVASGNRILVLDPEGQAWAWDASKTGNIKPERTRQDPGMRTVQAQALNQGFLLLNEDGQAYYLADNTTEPTAVNLPEGIKASRITADKNQAIITDRNGHVWSWKTDATPIRADNSSQPYTQAVLAGDRITAISRRGGIYRWSPDKQGQPGKPARLSTTTTPILETASLDGKALKLNKRNDAWQTDIPAHTPGQATILITGKQDNQPFTRSLEYSVDQPLTRDTEPRSTLTVRFDTGGGKPEPADQSVSTPNGRVKRPSPDPSREGFLFDGWFIGEVAYDFSRPVDKDLTLTAKWTPESQNSTWSISPDKGSQLGRESTTITPPESASRGIRFNQVSGGKDPSYGFSLAVGSDGNAYAWGDNTYGQLGDGTTTDRHTPVRVKTPDRNTYPNLPKDFTYLQVSTGWRHSLALGSDGNAYTWGYNNYGQLGDGTTTDRHTPVRVKTPDRKTYPDLPKDFTYLQVSAGYWHSLALGSDGNIYAWGFNGNGRLGDGTGTNRYTPVRVKTPDRNTYPDLPKDFTYLQVSGGGWHCLALGSDGNAYAWGDNFDGQLGDGTTTSRYTPVRVKTPDRKAYPNLPADFTFVQVSGGYWHSLALGSDGNAYTWGDNNEDGQLGDGTTTDRHTPVRVKTPDRKAYPNLPADFTYLQVSAGYFHSLALGSDGNAYAWGSNGNGRLGDGTTTDRHTPVRVKTPDRKTYPNLPADFTYLQVSAGGSHSLALGSEGNAYAWGFNNAGQLGNGTTNQSRVPVPVVFNLQLVITGVRFDQTPVSGLTRGDGGSVSVFTPAHQPGTVTVSVDYTLGGAAQTPDTTLRYTYLPAGVLPNAGGQGILLALATGMTGMSGVLASRRHRKEQHRLLHASRE